jgi:hypothetical protein
MMILTKVWRAGFNKVRRLDKIRWAQRDVDKFSFESDYEIYLD